MLFTVTASNPTLPKDKVIQEIESKVKYIEYTPEPNKAHIVIHVYEHEPHPEVDCWYLAKYIRPRKKKLIIFDIGRYPIEELTDTLLQALKEIAFPRLIRISIKTLRDSDRFDYDYKDTEGNAKYKTRKVNHGY